MTRARFPTTLLTDAEGYLAIEIGLAPSRSCGQYTNLISMVIGPPLYSNLASL